MAQQTQEPRGDLAERLVERLPIEEAEACLRKLDERLITIDVLAMADAQALADECTVSTGGGEVMSTFEGQWLSVSKLCVSKSILFDVGAEVILFQNRPTLIRSPNPALLTARFRCWHAHASVWIVTSFRPRPRMHEHTNAWWLLQLHALCALHTASHATQHSPCVRTRTAFRVSAPGPRSES
jgi:hypothetical protein